MDRETKNGVFKGIIQRIKRFVWYGSVGALSIGGGLGLIAPATEVERQINYIKHKDEIIGYQNSIDNYAKQFRNMNLSKLEIIMKTQKDMWENIKGYGDPEKDVFGYFGLDMEKGGVGVCRNMADDIARKLNAIDPSFNARYFVVYAGGGKYKYRESNIRTRHIMSNGKVYESPGGEIIEENGSNSVKNIGELIQKGTGNHAVVAVDIKEENVTLIVDPTSPTIGVYRNEKILIFNSLRGNHLDAKLLSNFVARGITGPGIVIDVANSFLKPSKSFKKLDAMYGLEAQNRALERVAQVEKQIKENNGFDTRVRTRDTKPNTDIAELQARSKELLEKTNKILEDIKGLSKDGDER